MDIKPRKAGVRFWIWMAIAFSLGTVVGVVACVCFLIVLQATISSAQ
jgi:hypothetical protein